MDGSTKYVSGKSNFLEDASKRRGGVKSIAVELAFPQVRNPIGWSPEKIINHATRMYYQTPFPPGGCEMNARTSTTASTDRRLDGTGTPCARTFPKRLVVGMGKGVQFSELNAKPPRPCRCGQRNGRVPDRVYLHSTHCNNEGRTVLLPITV